MGSETLELETKNFTNYNGMKTALTSGLCALGPAGFPTFSSHTPNKDKKQEPNFGKTKLSSFVIKRSF